MLRRAFRTLTNLLRRGRLERDLHDELAAYEDLLAAEHEAGGLAPEPARRAARLAFEGADHVKESVRDVRAGALLEQIARDLRYALRTLIRSPGFTVFTLLTFAVAIGGLTVIFSLANAVLLKPLPYREPDRLVMLLETDDDDLVGGNTVSAPNYQDWQRSSSAFQGMALFAYQTSNLSDRFEPEQVGSLRVSGGIFDLLGVRPLLGRGLLPVDDSTGQRVVVLSHRLWLRRYGADSSLVGQRIGINGAPWEVVGVMPPGFAFPSTDQQLWVPMHLTAQDQARDDHSFLSVARLADGVPVARARAELRVIGDRLAAEYPATNAGQTVNVFPMRDLWMEDAQRLLGILLAAVVLVLLIAAANIATLLLARDSARRREIAARMALGGSRARIIRQLATESAVLALGGAALGLALAASGTRALLALAPAALRFVPFRNLDSTSIDLTVFLVAGLAALLAGVLAGVAPALSILPAEPADVLRDAGGRSGTARRGRRLKGMLVGVEVAMSLVVLAGAGLLVASVRRGMQVDPGLDPAGVVAVELTLPQAAERGPAERVTFCADLEREIGGLPGVVAVSAVSHVPLSGASAGRTFVLAGAADPDPANPPFGSYGTVCPGYFHTMGIPLLSGRDFTSEDRAGAALVLIVNAALAERWFPEGKPVGRRIRLGNIDSKEAWATVIGVVGDVHHDGLTKDVKPYLYAPYAQAAWPRMSVMVRGVEGPAGPAAQLRPVLRRAFPGEPIGEVRTMEQVIERSLGHLRFPMMLFTVFAILAVALTALGCFGVASQAVVQRRRELGIRIALGASAMQLYRMVLGQGMRPVAWGLAAGAAGALAFTRLLRGLLFGIAPGDPRTLLLGITGLAAATLLACLIPARRAARLDPAAVLRDD